MGQGITFLVRVGRGQRLILFIYILYLLSGDGWYANISTAIVFVKDYRKAVVVVPTHFSMGVYLFSMVYILTIHHRVWLRVKCEQET